jgi:hypothetical protein
VNDQVSWRRWVPTVPLCAALVSLAGPGRAHAAIDFNPQAAVSASHNTNVFSRATDQPPFAATGNTQLGDTILRYLVASTADISWGLDRLTLTAQGERFDYNHFKELNHYESRFGGAFDWYLGPRLNGTLNYSQRRIMAPLADTLSEQLAIQTDKVTSGDFRYLLTPRWRIDLQPLWHDFESPLPLYPDFGDKETSLVVALKYLGIHRLTSGLRVEYMDGRYHGIINATRYHQTTAQLTANYAVSGFSSFDGALGYTNRKNDFASNQLVANQLGDTKAFTGSLGLHRAFSVKTSADLRLFREVESYVAGANSQISTGGEASLQWKPDVKFTVMLRYRMATQSIQGTLAIDNFANRTDHIHHGELDVEYHMLRWLTLRPYYVRDLRGSNFHDANFNSTVVGLDLIAHLKEQEELQVERK